MKQFFYAVLLISILISFAACDKRDPEITSMKDLKVNEDFTFNTVRPVKLILTSTDAKKGIVPSAAFTITRSDNKKVMDAKTNSEGRFEFTITVPSYERNLYLTSDGNTITLSIPTNGEITAGFIGSTSKAKAFCSYFTPAENQFGTLAFEDLWPSNGDYDINDLVLDFNVEERYDDNTWELTEMVFKYKVRAIGASRTIGFATTLPGYYVATGQPTSSNGLATWVSEHNTLVFFNNARDAVNDVSNEFFNTEHSKPYISDAEIVHEIILPVTEDWGKRSKMVWIPWMSAPFNPFIYINNNPGYQIHLKHYPVKPGYMNMALFNMDDDNSDVSYPSFPQSFQNHNYLPWGFYLAESISYPVERASILQAFPNFADWALSDGWDYQDWYLSPNLNYIYNPNH